MKIQILSYLLQPSCPTPFLLDGAGVIISKHKWIAYQLRGIADGHLLLVVIYWGYYLHRMLALPFLRRILRKVPILPSRPPPVPPKSTPSPISSRLPGREYKTAQERPHNMDGVIIPSETVPNELKVACEQTLKRAKELKKAEPVVAYWCRFTLSVFFRSRCS